MNGITMDQWMKMVPDSVVNLPEGLRNLLFQLYQTFITSGPLEMVPERSENHICGHDRCTDPRCYHRSADRYSPHGA